MIVAIAAAASAGPLADQVALHLGRDGRAVDSTALQLGYEALCAAGTKLACSWRAWDDWGRVKGDALARLADPVCAAGDTDACVALALAVGLGDAGDWTGEHADRAEQLLADACRAHDARGCAECRSMRDHGALAGCSDAAEVARPPLGTCDEGWLAACETPADAGDFDALERLCTADGSADGAWCAKLAAGRVTVQGVGQDRDPDLAVVTPSGLLLGWRGPRFFDHVLVPWGEVRIATLQVRPQKDEWLLIEPGTFPNTWARTVELEEPPGDEPAEPAPTVVGVALPHGCADVVGGVAALGAHRIPVVAKDADHGPARSVCAMDAGLTYLAGEITVVPMDPADDMPAGDVRRALSDASDGLFSCALAAYAVGGSLSKVDAEVKRARSGPAKRVVLVGGTGSVAEGCVLVWLRETPLGEAEVPARFVVRVALDW